MNIEGEVKKRPGRPKKAQESVPRETSTVVQAEEKPVLTEADRVSQMNKMANAIWLGQSPNLGLPERIGRIRAAMRKHGFIDIFEQLEINDTVNQSFFVANNMTYKSYL